MLNHTLQLTDSSTGQTMLIPFDLAGSDANHPLALLYAECLHYAQEAKLTTEITSTETSHVFFATAAVFDSLTLAGKYNKVLELEETIMQYSTAGNQALLLIESAGKGWRWYSSVLECVARIQQKGLLLTVFNF